MKVEANHRVAKAEWRERGKNKLRACMDVSSCHTVPSAMTMTFSRSKKRLRKPIGDPNRILLEMVHVSRHNSSTLLLKWKNKDRLTKLLRL